MNGFADAKRLFAMLAASFAVIAGVAYLGYRVEMGRPGSAVYRRALDRAGRLAADWPERPKLLAGLYLERYGPPDRAGAGSLIWTQRRPWKRIVVSRDPPDSPLEQTIYYDPPPDKLQAMRRFDHGIRLSPAEGEITARGDREGLNAMALNLAMEIALGFRTTEQAREFYAKNAELAAAGKINPYMRGLLFETRWPSPIRRER